MEDMSDHYHVAGSLEFSPRERVGLLNPETQPNEGSSEGISHNLVSEKMMTIHTFASLSPTCVRNVPDEEHHPAQVESPS